MAHDDGADVGAITHRAYARIGLFGNPSDGYFGRTISCSIQNFYAEVTLVPDQQPFSSRVSFEPGPYDWNAFNSLGALAAHTEKHGHYGGVRLLRALCCRFLILRWADLAVPLAGPRQGVDREGLIHRAAAPEPHRCYQGNGKAATGRHRLVRLLSRLLHVGSARRWGTA